jgi:hypothetical protein
MPVHCFTSISFSYLNRARVLGVTLKRHHPDWILWLLVTDKAPEGFSLRLDSEPWDRLVYATDLEIPSVCSWLFKHDVVEVCTAIKGPFLEWLINSDADKIIYLDPDIAVLDSLQPLLDMLEESSILLTPHQLQPDDETQSVWDNEICSLAHGTYNLGFLAVRNDPVGQACARWWANRCMRFCYDEKERGLFVDQKWCDLIPAFFDRVRIVRDPGYNVASWNLNCRVISAAQNGQFLVNERFPLRFFHFTKLGPIGDAMTQRYARGNWEVYELWAWYKQRVLEMSDPRIPEGWWHYGTYSNGDPINKLARRIYRTRADLQEAFRDPFDATGYLQWLRTRGRSEYPELGALG